MQKWTLTKKGVVIVIILPMVVIIDGNTNKRIGKPRIPGSLYVQGEMECLHRLKKNWMA